MLYFSTDTIRMTLTKSVRLKRANCVWERRDAVMVTSVVDRGKRSDAHVVKPLVCSSVNRRDLSTHEGWQLSLGLVMDLPLTLPLSMWTRDLAKRRAAFFDRQCSTRRWHSELQKMNLSLETELVREACSKDEQQRVQIVSYALIYFEAEWDVLFKSNGKWNWQVILRIKNIRFRFPKKKE